MDEDEREEEEEVEEEEERGGGIKREVRGGWRRTEQIGI